MAQQSSRLRHLLKGRLLWGLLQCTKSPMCFSGVRSGCRNLRMAAANPQHEGGMCCQP